eukprot:gene2256-2430_t
MEVLKEAYNKAKVNKDYDSMHMYANNIAAEYEREGDLKLAYRYHDLSLTHINAHLRLNPKDKRALYNKSIELRELAHVCITIKFEETIEHLKLAEDICFMNSFQTELINIYLIYFHYYEIKENYDECEVYYKKSLKIIQEEKKKKLEEKTKDLLQELEANINLVYGDLMVLLEEFDLAEDCFKISKNYYENLENNLRIADVFTSMGHLYLKKQLFEKSITNFELAGRKYNYLKEYSKEIDVIGNIGDAYCKYALFSEKNIVRNLSNSKKYFQDQIKQIKKYCPTNQEKIELNETNMIGVQQILNDYSSITVLMDEFKNVQLNDEAKLEILKKMTKKCLDSFMNKRFLLKLYTMSISKAKKIHSKSKFEFISNKIELLFDMVFEEYQDDLMSSLSNEINSAISLAELQNNRVYIDKFMNYSKKFIDFSNPLTNNATSLSSYKNEDKDVIVIEEEEEVEELPNIVISQELSQNKKRSRNELEIENQIEKSPSKKQKQDIQSNQNEIINQLEKIEIERKNDIILLWRCLKYWNEPEINWNGKEKHFEILHTLKRNTFPSEKSIELELNNEVENQIESIKIPEINRTYSDIYFNILIDTKDITDNPPKLEILQIHKDDNITESYFMLKIKKVIHKSEKKTIQKAFDSNEIFY